MCNATDLPVSGFLERFLGPGAIPPRKQGLVKGEKSQLLTNWPLDLTRVWYFLVGGVALGTLMPWKIKGMVHLQPSPMKMIWTKPPGNYVPAVNLPGSNSQKYLKIGRNPKGNTKVFQASMDFHGAIAVSLREGNNSPYKWPKIRGFHWGEISSPFVTGSHFVNRTLGSLW